jgi:hypothetical protein
MLSGIRGNQCDSLAPMRDERFDRGLKEDMKTAMDLLFEFKQGLEKLHPDCVRIIEKLLHNPNIHNHF